MNDDEMRKLNMNTEELDSKIQQINDINSQLFELFDLIKAQMESLQGEWESETSEEVFNNFEHAIEQFKKVKVARINDYKFLKNAYENYLKMEQSINNLVDENVATNANNFFTEQDKKATVDYTSGLDDTVVTVKNESIENKTAGTTSPEEGK